MTGIRIDPPVTQVITQPPRTIRAPANLTAQAAQKFEAMAIAQFLKPMFASMGKADAPFGAGSTGRTFQPFLIQAIAKSMEARGGLGLAPMIRAAMAAPDQAAAQPLRHFTPPTPGTSK